MKTRAIIALAGILLIALGLGWTFGIGAGLAAAGPMLCIDAAPPSGKGRRR